jgi:hypothetical protein
LRAAGANLDRQLFFVGRPIHTSVCSADTGEADARSRRAGPTRLPDLGRGPPFDPLRLPCRKSRTNAASPNTSPPGDLPLLARQRRAHGRRTGHGVLFGSGSFQLRLSLLLIYRVFCLFSLPSTFSFRFGHFLHRYSTSVGPFGLHVNVPYCSPPTPNLDQRTIYSTSHVRSALLR